MNGGLAKKRALITGAASGIGKELALELARHQVHLCLVDQRPEELGEVARFCRDHSVFVTTLCLDLLEESAATRVADHAARELQGLEILVNNAGIAYYGAFDQMAPEQSSNLLTLNLQVPLQLTHACLPLLLAERESRVLNVCSMYGFFPTQRSTAYHTSKFGLMGFSLALRAEYARFGLGSVCLCPGYVRTALYRNMLRPQTKPLREPPHWLSTTPQRVAQVGVRALRRNQRVCVVTWPARLAWLAGRAWPTLLDWGYQWEHKRSHRFAELKAETTPSPCPDDFPFPGNQTTPQASGGL